VHDLFHWLLHILGIEPRTPSTAYNFCIGAGSDFGELAIIGGLAHLVHQHNCHVKGCYRVGLHAYDQDGQVRKVCRKHHPHFRNVTHQELLDHADNQ